MAGAVARGAQTMNFMSLKPMLRKSYHRKSTSPDLICDNVKMNGEEMRNKSLVGDRDGNWWLPDDRTGIYFPKGQEKIMEDVPPTAGKDFGVNWLSNNEI
ncbi:uncharacterized protein LOC132286932 [Cornus florida]|uniref:uncharacterized protein LOC132286932 n=1 Tax=Cornus florida TaxID=4283 RepID=UPI0028972978|nr:uncharacterized protein LOC132286932 [Cornus florida]